MPEAWGYRPDSGAVRAGVQSGEAQKALRKVVPRAASQSRWGVRTAAGRAPPGIVSARCWSLTIRTTFGR